MLSSCRPAFDCESLERRLLLAADQDAILSWNSVALETLASEQQYTGPGFASRGLAMMHAAMFDAFNAIEGGYEPYLYAAPAPAGASVEAAVAAAAQRVLSTVFPGSAPAVAAAYSASLALVPDGSGEDQGVATGLAAADAIIAARADDGAFAQVPYEYGTDPGEYLPTFPDFDPQWGAAWGDVTPFGVESIDSYLPAGPPDLSSLRYAFALNEVKLLGAADSALRTDDQTEIAHFWRYDSQSYGSPVAMYNYMAQAIATQQGNTLEENARLFALANIAMADAGIAVWETKFRDNLWRPITAIREANSDGNPLTFADADWVPLGFETGGIDGRTPPFPAYTSGHAAFGAALFHTMADFYGTDNVSFELTSQELPGVVRQYDRFSDAAFENGISRVYLGVHFRFDSTNALEIGREIAADESATLLRPLNANDGSGQSDQPGHGPGFRFPLNQFTEHSRAAQGANLFSEEPIVAG